MNNSFSQSHNHIKSRWRNSLNQFSKLQEESKMCMLDTNIKKANFLKLKMKNRLGQVDPDFFPQEKKKQKQTKQDLKSCNNKLASTNHESNLVESVNELQFKNQYSVILESQQDLNYDKNNPEEISQIGQDQKLQQDFVENLTQYNQEKYIKQMKHLQKSASLKKSFIQSIFSKNQQIPKYCFHCDEKLLQNHVCLRPLSSLPRVDRALLRLKNQIQQQNKRIFSIFMHNLTLQEHDLEQLINHVKVLKTAHDLEYDPKQLMYRMRLMNLIGKKIGIIIHITSQNQNQ